MPQPPSGLPSRGITKARQVADLLCATWQAPKPSPTTSVAASPSRASLRTRQPTHGAVEARLQDRECYTAKQDDDESRLNILRLFFGQAPIPSVQFWENTLALLLPPAPLKRCEVRARYHSLLQAALDRTARCSSDPHGGGNLSNPLVPSITVCCLAKETQTAAMYRRLLVLESIDSNVALKAQQSIPGDGEKQEVAGGEQQQEVNSNASTGESARPCPCPCPCPCLLDKKTKSLVTTAANTPITWRGAIPGTRPKIWTEPTRFPVPFAPLVTRVIFARVACRAWTRRGPHHRATAAQSLLSREARPGCNHEPSRQPATPKCGTWLARARRCATWLAGRRSGLGW